MNRAARQNAKPTGERQVLHQPVSQRRFLLRGFRKLRRRHGVVRPAERLQQLFPVVRENLRLFPASRHCHIARPLVGRRERFAGHADEDLIHRNALAGMAGNAVAVGQMAEIPVDDPAVIDDDVAPLGESLDGQE